MAIKGKKKSQSRGSQARRRPAAPPRPVAPQRNRIRWYRTPTGIAALGIIAMVLIGVVVWAVQKNSDEAEKLENRQEVLDGYSAEVRTALQSLRAPIGAMAAAPPAIQDPEQAEQLAEDASGWVEDLEKAQTQFGQVVPAGSVQSVNSLYVQAVQIYISAAKAYEIAAVAEGEIQADTLGLAGTQRLQASSIWTEATALLDAMLKDAELDPSGLTAPDAPAPGTAPPVNSGELPTGIPTDQAPVEVPAAPEEESGGGGKGNGPGPGKGKGGGADGQ